MKIKDGLLLNDMGTEYVVVSEDSHVFKGMIKLNKSGAFVFGLLKENIRFEDIVSKMIEKYDIDEETAKNHLNDFLAVFHKAGLLENE